VSRLLGASWSPAEAVADLAWRFSLICRNPHLGPIRRAGKTWVGGFPELMRDRKTGELRSAISIERRNNLSFAAGALFLGLDLRTFELRDQRDPTRHGSLERWAEKARMPFGTLRHHATDLRPLFWTTQFREEKDDGSHRSTGPARRRLKPAVIDKVYAGDREARKLFDAAHETAKKNHAALEQLERAKSKPVGLPSPAFPPRPNLQPADQRPSPSNKVYAELRKMRAHLRTLEDDLAARAHAELLSIHSLEECAAWWVRHGTPSPVGQTSNHDAPVQPGAVVASSPASITRPQPSQSAHSPTRLYGELARMREHLHTLDEAIAARAHAELLSARSREDCAAWWSLFGPAPT